MRGQGALGPAACEELDPASNHMSECASVPHLGQPSAEIAAPVSAAGNLMGGPWLEDPTGLPLDSYS